MAVDPRLFVIKSSSKNATAKLPKLDRKLMWAVRHNNVTLVKSLLDNCQVNINCADVDEMTCLDFAIKKNNLNMVRLLLARNINMDPQRSDKCSPLLFAIANRRRKAAELLIRAGAVNSVTPLMTAIALSEYKLTKELLGLFKPDYLSGYTRLFWSTYESEPSIRVSKLVVNELFLRLSPLNIQGQAFLRESLLRHTGNHVITELLLDRLGVDPLYFEKGLETTLHFAAKGLNDNPEMVRILLKRGVEIDALGEDCKTALHYAALKGKPNMMQELLANGANVNSRTWLEGAYPLHLACTNYGIEDTIHQLITHGADVNARTKSGETALHNACRHMAEESIEALLGYGADPLLRDDSGRTAFQLLTDIDFRGSAKVMVRHMTAIELIEQQQLDDTDLELISQTPQLLEYRNQCAAEIMKMKSLPFYNDFTLFHVHFFLSEEKLSKFQRHEEFLRSFETTLAKRDFPCFQPLIRSKYCRVKEKIERRHALEELVLRLGPGASRLTLPDIDLVVDYLIEGYDGPNNPRPSEKLEKKWRDVS
ncbi:putative ankyrin repeat protein RF_0381 isoform X2 [Nasonia vitripennis]|uniref:Uncharacterized protein n=1 Tax=Nasonia vitripennis TaxID=7425 RepID=A0A7M7Q3E4_NASVI|nr:putative ankyrin repeat protein RF_0381 isoform X2 [Nasonia vitripennis]